MKKPFRFCFQSAVLAVSLVGGASAFAQDPAGAPETTAPPAHRGTMDPAQQLQGMTKRYNLSTDQQTQLKPILEANQQQIQALRGDSSLSREDRMGKMQSIHADTKTKIEAILNDDQKKQFEADQERMEQRRMQGGGGPGGGGPGGPGGGGPPPQQ